MLLYQLKIDPKETLGENIALIGITDLKDFNTEEIIGIIAQIVLIDRGFKTEFVKIKNKKKEDFETILNEIADKNFVRISLENPKIKCWQVGQKAGVTLSADDIIF